MGNINLPPKPYSLIESMRDIGYSLETAIADIIDNSITANARNIHVRFSWNNANPWIAIIDDGSGMDYNELVDAMRFVSQNPLDKRHANDLGRFGLGMKTASISQCRCLTVLSKKNYQVSCTQWDLDYLASLPNNNWSLKVIQPEDDNSNKILIDLSEKYLRNVISGTIVFWKELDRLGEGSAKITKESQFDEAINHVRKHLELVFHRFLTPKVGHKKIEIFFNENALVAFDPFNITKSTELHSEEFLYENERITVQPYVLPHHNKVSKTEWNKFSGERGYLHEQGFYVYRNRRLIISRTWFRLIKKEELTKLLRVKVDIPNTLDHLWRIDIKKSNAFPPPRIREGLKRIINNIEFEGKRVYKQRGQQLSSDTKVPGWRRTAKENQIFYEINKSHPLIVSFLEENAESNNHLILSILDMIESSFPRDTYFNDLATSPEIVNITALSKIKIERLLDFFIDHSKGIPDKGSLQKILQTDPFSVNKKVTKLIFNERGYDY
ncbi:MAG: ATP-binding protein [Balneola sp.]